MRCVVMHSMVASLFLYKNLYSFIIALDSHNARCFSAERVTNPLRFGIICSYELLKGVSAYQKIISCVLCAALLLTFLPAPAHAVTLTAINDSILPLDESTMPARLGGETYVPYSVFTTLGVSASENDGVLDLSANDETLSFSTAEGYVYDQNLNSYSTPAYEMNGTVYVPVKLCCAKFGFTYSSLTLQGKCAACRGRLGTERFGVYCGAYQGD